MTHKILMFLQKLSSSEKLQLPKEPLDESCLPCPIASNISLQQYNSFVESKEISGYKLDYKKGTVYMVEMCSTEHEAVVEIIGDAFRDLCPRAAYGSRNNAPIQILGQPLHDAPDGTRRAPDLAVYPHPTFVPDPPVPHPGPPPGDRRGNPYARVMLEVAVTQSYSDLKDKCRLWKRQSYVRSVLGIKLYNALATRDAAGRRERAMKWHFGTVDKNGNHFPPDTNVCNTANDPNYIINIPVSDIFYDPPVPATGYTPLTGPPLALYNAIIAIDLYEVQQAVLMKQEK
ncbi:4724_t:CDS:2 [Funneliformis caledonium]|uniref:4724_t:CDS:1 n=1 Tax=Funneliformis caledonium TaxID=1117310 RepID=A0A9N9EGZ8_9GLOM|nr:4724_t:CDS:2 [Funneliformis caledonium]